MASRRRTFLVVVACCALLSALALSAFAAPPTPADELFEREVRPLLIESCYKCHGEKKAESSLRLDSRPALMQGGDSGPAIVPGKPGESLLVKVVSHQSDIEMPPEGELSGEQVAVLEKWIEAGAPWPGAGATASPRKSRTGEPTEEERKLWSLQPIADPAVPQVSGAATPIDAFILAKLNEKGIKQVAPADKHTLLRRLTFDLTGLPPTPAEIDEFTKDQSPDATARLIDRLLASPAYGERWGRHWLDVVRYADTAGETADYPVPQAWKYRNYVIKSFNDDKPYDQFVREQVAGDLLPATDPANYAEHVTATGFLAISRRFGFDSRNYQHLTIQDSIDTMGQTFLGLSLGCARCHDHKYDPVAATDYYALYGIFASTKYAFPGDEETRRPKDFPGAIPQAEAAGLKKQHDAAVAAADAALKAADADRAKQATELTALIGTDSGFEFQTVGQALTTPWRSIDHTQASAEAQSPYSNVQPKGVQGIRFANDQANNAIEQAVSPPRTANDTPRLYFNVDFRNTNVASGGEGSYRFYLGHGSGTSAAMELFANGNAFFVRNGDQIEKIRDLELGAWYNVQVELNLEARTFRGVIATPGNSTSFENKGFFPTWDGTIDNFFVDGYGHLGGIKPEHDVDNVVVRNEAMPAVDISVAAAEVSGTANTVAVEAKARIAALDQSVATLKQQHQALVEKEPYEWIYGVNEGEPQNVKIHRRGEPTKLGDEVPRRFVTVLGGDPLPADEKGSGRKQLAEWLTRDSNPLTARVMVNRVWQHHFGQGLVATENDFGVRGTPPTHPELLDWLARRFMESGWSLKWLHRQILATATYQLSSRQDAACAAVDPANELLWRFGRRRLDAEEVRDSLLAVGGKLDRTPGAGHPFPPVSTWGFSQHGPFNAIYDVPRRSVYLMTQRLSRHPFLALFDGADTNATTPQRSTTTVPTQALFWMNDPLVHEQSAGFASQLLAISDPTEQTRNAYRMAYGREPDAAEVDACRMFLDRYRAQLQAANIPADQQDALAWAAFARTLFAANEFVFVD